MISIPLILQGVLFVNVNFLASYEGRIKVVYVSMQNFIISLIVFYFRSNFRHEKKLKMSTNWIFKQERVHIITVQKKPILSIQGLMVNIL